MVREDIVSQAVTFLQTPNVAESPVEKRIEYLQSKNLTQEEIDLAFARATGEDPGQATPPPRYTPPSNTYRSPPQSPSYGNYPQQGFWQQPPPPEPPKRDWRDYFIMATVMGGVGYGLYFTAKRYILPVIKPPTPPQLEQDKASVDDSFKRAFDLLEQLNTDTTALKASEEARTQKLDTALGEVESVLASLKDSSRRQGDDNRRIEDDVRGLRDLIPKALDAQKESTDNRLKELSNELKSLKTLVGNRLSTNNTVRPPTAPYYSATQTQSPATSTSNINGTPASAPTTQSTSIPTPSNQQTNTTTATGGQASGSGATSSASGADKPVQSWRGNQTGRAAIPAWQMAAAKKTEENKDTSESGTAAEASSSS